MSNTNLNSFIAQIPENITLVAATKSRTAGEIRAAISKGIRIVGENYVQEAYLKFTEIGNQEVQWHLIGHLQKNKVKKAVSFFDMIQTLDSIEIAERIHNECGFLKKTMPVLIQINIAEEQKKYGISPNKLESFLQDLSGFKTLNIAGLMTMGPDLGDPEQLRPFFKEAKSLFDQVTLSRSELSGWKYLSMGMSSSHKVAIEEGANMVRIGNSIFGPRETENP